MTSTFNSPTLATVARNADVTIRRVELERELLDYLRAVGIYEGERLRVLRRAPFGGPLHVRTSSGGEFALGGSLAGRIFVDAAETP